VDTAHDLFLSNAALAHRQERETDYARRAGIVTGIASWEGGCDRPKREKRQTRTQGPKQQPLRAKSVAQEIRHHPRKVALREWLHAHMDSGPTRWNLFRVADVMALVPADLRVPNASMLSVIALELDRAGFVCHQSSNTQRGMTPRLWSPKNCAARTSALTAGERTARYETQCAARARR